MSMDVAADAPCRLAIVEDDRSLRETLAAVLEHQRHHVSAFGSAEELLQDVDAPDLVILDVGLPGMDGVACCAELRRRHFDGPILMLTARHEVPDRVRGLDAGADDYLVKPFALDELLARVRSMARRTASTRHGTVLTLGDLVIDVDRREVSRDGEPMPLTKLEFDLAHLLVANSPRVLTREVIHDRVWGYDGEHMSNSLEVAISQLRRKLEASRRSRLVHTVRGVGYVARVDGAVAAAR